MMFRIGVKFGMLLSGFMAISHSLEVFANLQPPLPAVRGVAMWALMFLVCSAASAVTYDRAKAVSLGIGASVDQEFVAGSKTAASLTLAPRSPPNM